MTGAPGVADLGPPNRPRTAPTPEGLEPGSLPELVEGRPAIEALAVYLRSCHSIGFERLSALFGDVFGVTISDGALANRFKRVKPCFT